MLIIIYLTKNLGSYVRLVMLYWVMVRLNSRSAALLRLQCFLFTSDHSRPWFIYLLLSLFNE